MAGFDWGSIAAAAVPALIQAGGSLFQNLYPARDPDASARLAEESRQFNATSEFHQQELAQQLAIAQMNAAAAGAGSGAAVAAARIKAAVDREAIQQQAREAGLTGKMRAIEFRDPKTINDAGKALADQKAETGRTAVSAFDAMVGRLQAPLLKR